MNSQADKAANLAAAERLIREAASGGAELIVLPEKFNVMGSTRDYFENAEQLTGETISLCASLAREYGVDIVAGSIVERVDGQEKLANTSVHLGADGEIKASYRKIHMFDVVVDGQVYRESDHEDPGDAIVTSELEDGTSLGLTVCYDVRFPELYRILALRGALIQTIPAAFTQTTGEVHWELLVRTRAVENQLFVVAAGQFGFHDRDRLSYGNSMIVSPWGEILARAPGEGEAVIAAELDFDSLKAIRDKLPSLANRVPGAYSW